IPRSNGPGSQTWGAPQQSCAAGRVSIEPSLVPCSLIWRLHERQRGMPSGGTLLDVRRFVANMDQAILVQELVAFRDHQHVVSAGEKRDALAPGLLRGIPEELGGNIQRRRRLVDGSDERMRRGGGLLRSRLGRGRRLGHENIAMRAGVFELAELVELVDSEAR